MVYSYAQNLYCPKCAKQFDLHQINQLCPCGAPLLVSYDLERVKAECDKSKLIARTADLWRYHELLPVQDKAYVVSLGEGMTPLLKTAAIGLDMDISNLYIKDEGIIPTGTFKARGAAIGVSRAKELGVQEFAMPTNGNAGAAWALYGAKAAIKATIVMPKDAPLITRSECYISGANLKLVDGVISDAGKVVAALIKEQGLYDVSTLKEPYRIEGKKTMGLEIAEQLGWKMPDVILYPTGGGVGLIGIYKALSELLEIGWVQGDLPRLVSVQAERCAPIVAAWQQGKPYSEFWDNSQTVAFGINVPKALGDFLVLDAIYKTAGCAVSVTDDELLQEQQRLAATEGMFICPEGAAAVNAARKLRADGWIKQAETVVVLNTGIGVKYPNTVRIPN